MNKAVGAIIDLGQGQIALQLRDRKPGLDFSGKVVPFGGGLEKGERSRDGLARELFEELGIRLEEHRHECFWTGQFRDDALVWNAYDLYVVWDVKVQDLQVTEGHLCVVNATKGLVTLDLVEDIREPMENAAALICARIVS